MIVDVPQVYRLADLLANPAMLEPPKALIPRLVWKERVTVFAAREKLGKTTLVAAGAAAASRGNLFLDELTVSGSVLWLALDQHLADLVRLFRQFDADPERVFVVATPPAPEQLEDIVAEYAPSILVVDTLAEYAGEDVTDASAAAQWQPVFAGLRNLARDHEVGILLNHHGKKSDGGYRDSTAIGAGADMIIEMKDGLEDPTVRRLTHKGRWSVPTTQLRYSEETGYECTTGELSVETKVTLYVEGHPGCTMAQLKAYIGRRANEVVSVANRLEDKGVIRDQGKGIRHAYYMVRPDDSESYHSHRSPIGGNTGTVSTERSYRSRESVVGMPVGTDGNGTGTEKDNRSDGSTVPDPGTVDEATERTAIQAKGEAA